MSSDVIENGITRVVGVAGGQAVPVSGTVTATGAATEATLAAQSAKITACDTTGKATAALQTTANAALGAGGTWTPATAAAADDDAQISAAACYAAEVLAANSHATITYYLMLFDATSLPANGTAPRIPAIPLAAGQSVSLPVRLTCATGLYWAASTTVSTLTVSATTPFQVSALLVA